MICNDLAYVLHTRPYRETSQLVSVYTRGQGRFSLVARGSRGGKKTQPLQSFCRFQIAWSGTADLKTLTGAELVEHRVLLGRNLYIGLYLNELLTRLGQDFHPAERIFDLYTLLVARLAEAGDSEALLRSFEWQLLEELGCGFALDREAATGEPVSAAGRYRFDPQRGLLCARGDSGPGCFRGDDLLALARGDLSRQPTRLAAKQLMRLALQPHLGARPLLSRELFRGTIDSGGARA